MDDAEKKLRQALAQPKIEMGSVLLRVRDLLEDEGAVRWCEACNCPIFVGRDKFWNDEEGVVGCCEGDRPLGWEDFNWPKDAPCYGKLAGLAVPDTIPLAETLRSDQWDCRCGYQNTGPICTKCGQLRQGQRR